MVEQECVFCDIDGRDLLESTVHYWLEDGATITSYLRVLAENPTTLRIGRVVTTPERRGQRLSSRLLEAALADIAEQSEVVATVLDAQSHLQSFYASHGYVVDGDEFVEDGIAHIPMRRRQ